jgi:gliding motility-associated-like protein
MELLDLTYEKQLLNKEMKISYSYFNTISLRKALLSMALTVASFLTFAQQDNLFYFAAPDISSSQGENPISLKLLSYDDAATVTISQPANGGFTPIVVNLAANSVSTVDLSAFLADIESPSADNINSNGLKIVSTEMITAYYELSAPSNKEVFSLKGSKGIGTNFYTPFQKNWANASVSPGTFSSIEVVATEDNTIVAITPKTDIVGHTVGATFNVTLDEGETYSARDVNLSAASSLAGSIVSSNKPISVTVFSGALVNSGCNSSMGDQITPTDYLGTDFIIRKGTSSDDRVYILGTQNNTGITIENLSTTTSLINWSETYELDLTDDINYIKTTKPVYVWHASGNGCNLNGAQVPHIFCAGKYDQTFSRGSADSLGVLVHIRAGYEDDFLLNGNASLLTAADFSVVPGTGGEFVVAMKYFNTTQIPVGSFNKLTNTEEIFGLAIMNGTSGSGSGFAYLSEFLSYPFIDAGLDNSICANMPFSVDGLIGGGDVTAVWSHTGFGSFNSATNVLTNEYQAAQIDSIISPIELILTSTGPCPEIKDTLILTVTPAPIVNANTDQIVCANNATIDLSGTVSGGASTGVWTTPNGSGAFLPNNTDLNAQYIPSNADTTAGNVTIVLTSTGPVSCNQVSDTMFVTITPAPFVEAGPPNMSVCSNNPGFSLSGSVGGGSSTGKWTTSGNGSFSPDNLSLNCSYSPSPLDVNGGSIWIYLTSTNNSPCLAVKDSIQVTFTAPPTVNAGVDLFACFNEAEVDLSGLVSGPTTTGEWTGGAGMYTPDNQTLVTSYTPTSGEVTSGSITLTLTSTNNGNCLAVTDQVSIDFVAPPFANFDYNNVCLNEEMVFTDFSINGFGNIIDWNYNFGDATTANTPDAVHTYNADGTYNVELIVQSDAGCYDTTTKVVTVYELPVADFTYSSSCENELIVIDFEDASTVSSGTIDSWFYDFGGQGQQSTANPSQLFMGEGNFIITHIVETDNGCSDTILQTITIPPSPNAAFFYNTPNGINVGAEFNFIDTSDYAASWYWELGNGETSTDQNPTTVYFENTTYEVTLYATGPLGCVDSTTQTITIDNVTTEINLLIPNAISPNGDGKNDVWKLEFIEFVNPEAQIIIMNKWGQTIFESIGYSNPWDGRVGGELVPEGNYYYIIKLSDTEIFKGALLVMNSGTN